MTKILNLALKKEVFEGLQNQTTNEIPIENSKWWKKRLMDLDTGRFKDFTTASVSCGSPEKFLYDIEKIELRENTFVITVVLPDAVNEETPQVKEVPEMVEPEIETPKTVEPETEEPVEEAVPEPVEKQEYEEPTVTITEKVVTETKPVEEPKEEKNGPVVIKDTPDVKTTVMNLFNNFCKMKDVYVVNMPNVTIRNNGQVFGCNKRLIADRDSDVKFNFEKKEFVKYPYTSDGEFSLRILTYLNKLLQNNYVFINKSACGFREGDGGNIIFTIVAIGKRKYFFAK